MVISGRVLKVSTSYMPPNLCSYSIWEREEAYQKHIGASFLRTQICALTLRENVEEEDKGGKSCFSVWKYMQHDAKGHRKKERVCSLFN